MSSSAVSPVSIPAFVSARFSRRETRSSPAKRKEGFDEKSARNNCSRPRSGSTQETGVPGMADIVANTGKEFQDVHRFCQRDEQHALLHRRVGHEAQTGRRGLLRRKGAARPDVLQQPDRLGTGPGNRDPEIAEIGVKHVLLVAFDQEDQMPSGRITGTQKLLDAIEKVGAKFESIFVDTSVMNGPATAFCGVANRMIKEKWGFPTASAPSNGSYMDLKRFKDMWDFKGWSSTDAALEALSAFYLS